MRNDSDHARWNCVTGAGSSVHLRTRRRVPDSTNLIGHKRLHRNTDVFSEPSWCAEPCAFLIVILAVCALQNTTFNQGYRTATIGMYLH
jgi:hypothetical protein